jgi:hypothetical protein
VESRQAIKIFFSPANALVAGRKPAHQSVFLCLNVEFHGGDFVGGAKQALA